MIISRTPLRISFLGGGTDYAPWYRENGGRVLATAIDKYTYITCRPRSSLSARRWRVVYSREELTDDVSALVHPPTRACLELLGMRDGLEIHSDADLPARTGLGSSSSFTVGLLHALHALHGRRPGPLELTREALRVERSILAEPGGAQDQVLAAFGGLNRVDFVGNDEFVVTPLPLSPARRDELCSHLLLLFTGFTRSAPMIAADQMRRIPETRRELEALGLLADEGCRLLCSNGHLRSFGHLLHEAWGLKKRLSQGISTPAIDAWYQRGLGAGALGGKLLGAGGGGFLLFFAPPDAHARITSQTGLTPVPFRFAGSGSKIIFASEEWP